MGLFVEYLRRVYTVERFLRLIISGDWWWYCGQCAAAVTVCMSQCSEYVSESRSRRVRNPGPRPVKPHACGNLSLVQIFATIGVIGYR